MAAFSAIDSKMSIGCEHLACVGQFAHAHKTCVRRAHRLVHVLAQESYDIRPMIVDREIEKNQPAFEKAKNGFDGDAFGLKDEDGLRQYRFARPQGIEARIPALNS